MNTKKFIKKLLIISTAVFLITGCVPKLTIPTPPPAGPSANTGVEKKIEPKTLREKLAAQSQIKKFGSIDDLKVFLEEEGASSMSNSYSRGMGIGSVANDMLWGGFETDAVMESAPMAKSAAPSPVPTQDAGAGSDDFSTTNIQVEGVDEADIIKTDGKYIYAVVKNNLYITLAYPAEKAEVLTKIEFKSRPQDIYINGDYLAIYGDDTQIYRNELYSRFKRRGNFTFLKVFDISDRKNPVQVRDLDFEGGYTNSRMIGNYVYFISTHYNYYYMEGEPVLPRIMAEGEVINLDCAESIGCVMPDIYYFNIPYSSYNFTSISAINVKNNSEPIESDVYLMNANQNMFVSLNNIYTTYTKYISEYELEMEVLKELLFPRLSLRDQERIIKIEDVENFILSPAEKNQKITRIIERYTASLNPDEQSNLETDLENKMKQKYDDISKELEKTVIHKISIDGKNIEYKTFGEVTGQVLNQFSMDENKGYFRIATTKNQTWSRFDRERAESYNNLYILDENLKEVGAVERLAEGERIYSVRFMQDRAYMVTFKQVDPLFVIDVSNPRNPKVLGKLKIPGFSNYLHPYDNDTLIGIGKDTKENEWGGVTTGGVKLSLFDVSDVANPKEIDNYILGDSGSDSIALNDHKAFLFSHDKNLLVIPATIRDILDNRGIGRFGFSGAVVFNVNKSGFELKGKIDHSDDGRDSEKDYWRGYNYYDNTVRRSLYIDDTLYTFSNNYLKMNDLSDLDLIKNLKLEKTKSVGDDDFEIVN